MKVMQLKRDHDVLVHFAEGLLEMIREVCNEDTFRRLADEAFNAAARIAAEIEALVLRQTPLAKRLWSGVSAFVSRWQKNVTEFVAKNLVRA